ncbi:hypothetical protein M409DRAFT_69301 [Zasmidium cellare ATCC 36951]|uniref:BTB domain-containing protein n=1 Tax=Zasmidium cellare ATCC 36951 TaxID=1080233 RepID=A0A6A6C738_ZASCE|nr:uncharacterized protein M409DRAFT_69301 [Zasmidium cellare ATCC 36951]KAF2162068.1 hypothetical protein M409DRAFT_69301 [Zasmidium cellare ATCC 36951]
MSGSSYLGHSARLRLLELGGRSPSYQDTVNDEAENLRKRLLSGPTVDILVGPEGKHWSLHRNLLCHHSSYFESEFHDYDGPKKNGTRDNILELPDDDPMGFELLVKWLYQGQLEDASQLSEEAKYDYAVACHKLYLLCDKFDMTRLKNISMDQYRQCLNECQLVPDAEEINDIYRASPVGSPFRSLMIRIAARQIMDPEIDRDAEAYRKCFENNPDFAVEMVNAIRYMSGGILFDDPTYGDLCSYHDHNDVSGCQFEGKGKAKANGKARAVNGQGPFTTAGAPQQYISIPLMAELSSDRRTPRKLNTPSTSPVVSKKATPNRSTAVNGTPARAIIRTPAANSGQRRLPVQKGNEAYTRPNDQTSSAPRSLPPKLEKRGPVNGATPKTTNGPSPIVSRSVPNRTSSVSSVESPFDPTGQDPMALKGAMLRLSAPRMKSVAPNPTEQSPLVSRSVKRIPTIVMNGEALLPAIMSPTPSQPPPKANGHGGLELTKQRLKRVPQRPKPGMNGRSTNSARSAMSTEVDAQSTTSSRSRKRKFEDRTPNRPKTRPANGVSKPDHHNNNSTSNYRRTSSYAPSSRSVSVASGPRKLSRISSVAKQPNGTRGAMSVDSRKETSSNTSRSTSGQKGRPPKLATNGHRTAKDKEKNDSMATK